MKRVLAALLVFTALGTFATPRMEPDTIGTTNSTPYVTHTKAVSVAVYPNKDHSKMHLMVENHVEIPLFISFVSGQDRLYNLKVGKRTRAFHTQFDLSQLKDGDYQIEVSDGLNKIVKRFHVSTPPKRYEPVRALIAIE